MIGSPIKGFLGHYEADGVDLIEAVLSPIRTKSRWICSLGDFAGACAFDFAGAPVPRAVRVAYIKNLFSEKNFKKLIFRSKAGQETLSSYGVDPASLDGKVTVVYPAVRRIADDLVRFSNRDLRLFFAGDVFPQRRRSLHRCVRACPQALSRHFTDRVLRRVDRTVFYGRSALSLLYSFKRGET